MPLNDYSDDIATFMHAEFQYRLAVTTRSSKVPDKPIPPQAIDKELLQGCQAAVDVCVNAYVSPCKSTMIRQT